jgi:hypothetical protein
MHMTDRTSPAPRREALGPWIRLQTHMTPSHLAWAGEAAAVAFVAAVAALAHGTGLVYVLFPELGALAFDTLKRPHGAWARAPVMLVATPTLAGAVGTLVTQQMAFGLGSVFLVLGVSLLIIKLLRSPVAPAMSAGLLPLVLGDTSWWYPPSLLLGLGLLAGASQLWRRHHPARTAPASPDHPTKPRDFSWAPYFIAFIAVVTLLALGAGLRFLLFPPLAVIGYEMFAHAPTCPWAKRPFALPLACTLAAVAGVALVGALGPGPLTAACALLAGVGILRVLDLHAPPALAVALLPLIMAKPDYAFAGAVATTTLLLSGLFVAWRKMGAKAQPA